jgi:ketosteroid isomerase-like protein
MNHAEFQAWLDRYIAAWRSGEPGAIGDLFSADAAYFYGPYREPVRGRAAIVAEWTREPDEPGSWEAEYRPLAIDGDTAVATGESRYPAEGRTYSNIFVCRFDTDGRCTEFREWFMAKPRADRVTS